MKGGWINNNNDQLIFQPKKCDKSPERCCELSTQISCQVNEINGLISRLLVVCETKERDKASKLVMQTLEITSNKASRNQDLVNFLVQFASKFSSSIF